jgi:hypothetical protein
MTTLDRPTFDLEPKLEPVRPSVPRLPQGELFARLMLRQLPVMKHGPEDDAPLTLH